MTNRGHISKRIPCRLRDCLFAASSSMMLFTFTGCGDAVSGEFRDYDKMESAEQLPEITPGPAGGSDEVDDTPKPDPTTSAEEPTRSGDSADDSSDNTTDQAAVTATPDQIPTRPDRTAGALGPVKEEKPREVKLLIENKEFRTEKSGDVRVSYDDIDLLKVLNMQPVPADAVDHFPKWLRDLDGKRIRIRGFMYPTMDEDGITDFVIARDNGICCFVRKPKIYDVIWIEMKSGLTTKYIEGRPFDVSGVFHIDPDVEDGEFLQLYRIDDAKVIDGKRR